MRDCFTVFRPHSCSESRGASPRARRRWSSPHREWRAGDTPRRVADWPRAPVGQTEVGAGRGCGSPRRPPSVRPRTPRAAVRSTSRERRFSLRDSRRDGASRAPVLERLLDHGRARSGGKVGAALAAPATDHRASRSIAHPETEAVLLLPLAVVRLVCPFHPWPPRTPGPRCGAPGRARGMYFEHARTSGNAESMGWSRTSAIHPQWAGAAGRTGRSPRQTSLGCVLVASVGTTG